jgi:hypothetical protein
MALQNNLFWPPQPAKMEEAPSIQIGGRSAVIKSFRTVGNPDHGRAGRQPGRMFMHRQHWAWSPASAACGAAQCRWPG